MLKRKYIGFSFLWSLFVMQCAFCQTSSLQFEEKEFDFKKTVFQDTLQHRFYFKNTSNSSINITEIKTDCACTFAQDTQKQIEAGDSSFIDLFYLPYSYGSFVKVFTVHTDKAGTESLMLKGYLRPAPDYEKEFVHQSGKLKLRTKYMHFGNILNRPSITKKFEFYNPTASDFVFTGAMQTPEYIRVRFDSTHIIKAGQTGAIYVIYDAKQKNDFGYVEDVITLEAEHDGNEEKIDLVVTASITEELPDVSELSEDALEAYPELVIDKSYVNLGRKYLKNLESDSLLATFVLRNRSNMPLKIHRIVEGYGCQVITEKDKWKELAPHSNAMVLVSLQVPDKKGTYVRALTLICNDPKEPIRTLKVQVSFR